MSLAEFLILALLDRETVRVAGLQVADDFQRLALGDGVAEHRVVFEAGCGVAGLDVFVHVGRALEG